MPANLSWWLWAGIKNRQDAVSDTLIRKAGGWAVHFKNTLRISLTACYNNTVSVIWKFCDAEPVVSLTFKDNIHFPGTLCLKNTMLSWGQKSFWQPFHPGRVLEYSELSFLRGQALWQKRRRYFVLGKKSDFYRLCVTVGFVVPSLLLGRICNEGKPLCPWGFLSPQRQKPFLRSIVHSSKVYRCLEQSRNKVPLISWVLC